MSKNTERVTISRELSTEGKVMNKAFKTATARASKEAYLVRKTVLVERDGWLVRVRQDGTVWRKVKRIPPLRLPKR